MKDKGFLIVFFITVLLLFIPLIAMQCTNEVNWGVFDFLIAGILLLGLGLLLKFVIKKTKNRSYRIVLFLLLILLFLFIWVELAVGVFGRYLLVIDFE